MNGSLSSKFARLFRDFFPMIRYVVTSRRPQLVWNNVEKHVKPLLSRRLCLISRQNCMIRANLIVKVFAMKTTPDLPISYRMNRTSTTTSRSSSTTRNNDDKRERNPRLAVKDDIQCQETRRRRRNCPFYGTFKR